MKTFSTSGTGSQQTLSEIESDKMPVYDSLTDVTADLANLEVGQIGATKGTGSELSAPVDTVQSGNMHAVTSNAVSKGLSYSTTEQKTGGKWIDGKPTYKKVITQTNYQYQTAIDNVLDNPDTIVDFRIIITTSQGNVYFGNATSGLGNYITEIFYSRSTNRIYYTGGADRGTLAEVIFILEYTKTTDI